MYRPYSGRAQPWLPEATAAEWSPGIRVGRGGAVGAPDYVGGFLLAAA